jgi:hypothetical protein
MSTINFSQTQSEVINTAFILLGVLGTGQTLRSEDANLAATLLNMLVKSYQAQGLHVWTEEEAYLFLAKGVPDYYLGNQASSPAYACYKEGAHITQLSAAPLLGDTTLNLTSSAGMTIGDYIGVVLQDFSIQWTTIATIPNGTSVTITVALTQASSVNNNVYSFTTLIDKPLRIPSVRRVLGTAPNPSAIAMSQYSHDEYFRIPTRNLSSVPIVFYHQPRTTYSQFHIWPASNTCQTYLEITMERQLMDINTANTIPDFPDEWLEVLTYQLAVRLAPAYGREDKCNKEIAPLASVLLQQLLAWDSEVVSINLQPETKPYQ